MGDAADAEKLEGVVRCAQLLGEASDSDTS